jgi:hypothetical protein
MNLNGWFAAKHRLRIPVGSLFISSAAYYVLTTITHVEDDDEKKNTATSTTPSSTNGNNDTMKWNHHHTHNSTWNPWGVQNIIPPSTNTTTYTSCDFFMPRHSLGRRRTIKRMKDSSTKQSLESKYDVQWTRPLGEGGFGAVYIGTDKKTGEYVAVKKISKRFTNDTR